ncbi:hypothetical protein Tco_0339761 [Tanacetum coccineum]
MPMKYRIDEREGRELRCMARRAAYLSRRRSNQQMTPPHFNTYQSSYNNPQLQQQFLPLQQFSPSQHASIQPNQHYLSHYPSQAQFNHFIQIARTLAVRDGRGSEEGALKGNGIMQQAMFIRSSRKQKNIRLEEQLATEDLGTYDSDCDDLSRAQAVLMANISSYGSDVILEAQQDSMILFVIEQMSEQMINHVNNWEKANKEQNNELITVELERYNERVKTFEQRLNIDLSRREKMIDSQIDDMIRKKLALKKQIDSLEQNLSKQIKEKESVLQTLVAVFKNESKEKENKYMETEIDLEKKI